MSDALARYRDQQLITAAEHAAGLQFAEDHRAARRWRDQRRGEDRAAATRYAKACEELDDLRFVALAVAVMGLGVATFSERMSRPFSTGMPELRQALRVLAGFYARHEEQAA